MKSMTFVSFHRIYFFILSGSWNFSLRTWCLRIVGLKNLVFSVSTPPLELCVLCIHHPRKYLATPSMVSHFDTCVGKKCATKFFPLFRVLGPPGWDIFPNFFLDILGMFLNYFPRIWHILFVCQSFIWLTSVLWLGQYRYISWKRYL